MQKCVMFMDTVLSGGRRILQMGLPIYPTLNIFISDWIRS